VRTPVVVGLVVAVGVISGVGGASTSRAATGSSPRSRRPRAPDPTRPPSSTPAGT